MADFKALEDKWTKAIAAADGTAALEELRVGALGKKGEISGLLKTLGSLTPEERKEQGPAINTLKDRINSCLAQRKAALENAELDARLALEAMDVTLPSRLTDTGRIHPVSQVMDELSEIFAAMGFDVAEGPDIEDDFHNFTALNIPPEHPARQMHDTFYLEAQEGAEPLVLRTHTSPVQIRTMQTNKPPIRIVAPGRTYRSDSDATHTPMFHQVEGLVIDTDTHMGHLKGTLETFIKAFFELDTVEMRFRPSYFPFTEPSAEVDIRCSFEGDKISLGSGDDWMEILGCGMVNPKVLEHCDLDPTKYQGFAFGCGIDRLAMLKYGMRDLRPFFDSDLRWLKHYGFMPLDIPTAARGMSR